MNKKIASIITTAAVWGTIATSAFAAPIVFSENGEITAAPVRVTTQQAAQDHVDHTPWVFRENGEYIAVP